MSDLEMNPDMATTGATGIAGAADELAPKFQALKGRIEALNAMAPWGKDEAGQNFATNYTPGVQGFVDGGQFLVNEFTQVGPAIHQVVRNTVAQDEASAESLTIEGL